MIQSWSMVQRFVVRTLCMYALVTAIAAAVAAPAGAMTLFSSEAPVVEADSDAVPTELGVRFRSSVAGTVTGVRFYKGAGNTGTHIGSLWSSGGVRLAQVTFSGESAGGWQQADFSTPVSVAANTTYVASYHAPNGHYSITERFFTSAWVVGIMRAPAQAGVYKYGAAGSFPNQRFEDSSYFVDVVFEPTDTAAPTAPGSVAASGVTSASAHLSWTASTDDVGVTGYEVLRGGVVVASLAASARSYDFSGLAETTSYALGVRAVDGVGNRSATSSVSLTTPVAQSAYTLFAPDAVPDIVDTNDTGAVELGVKFTSDVAGTIRGVRFYKSAANTGTHTGSLWTSSGTRLATATFVAEGPSGWQTVLFASPVTISANTTYVASYHLNVGHYSATEDALDAAGIDSPPLHAPRSSTIGGNGVYRYGASAFPNNTYRASNYFVDPLFLPLSSLSPRSVDGSGATVAWQSSASSLAAEWAPPAAEAATIASYDWCFTASTQDNCAAPLTGTNASGNQAGTSVTATGLALTSLTATYRACVRPRYAAGGVIGAWACSAGVRVDDAAPAAPASVLDGAGATDMTWLASRSTHAASWTAASDGSGSGVSRYEWCLSATTGCASGVAASGATSNATTLSASLTGLDLTEGARYYFCVRARDVAGNAGAYGCSNGVDVDTTGPTNPAVSDGLDVADLQWQAAANQLAAQWGVGSDATSGVASYDWCFATAAVTLSCVDPVGGAAGSGMATTERTRTIAGLALDASTATYYACVRARDAAGNIAAAWSCSDGIRVDVDAPSVPEPSAPADEAVLDGDAENAGLAWVASTDPRSGIARYEYKVALAGNLAAATWHQTVAASATTPVVPGASYEWVVRAVDQVGNTSVASVVRSFSVASGDGPDVVAPVVTVPADRAVEATSQGGASVSFDVSALDDVDGVVAVSCDRVSGSVFPLGVTVVTCTASDVAGNVGDAQFEVEVADTTAPVLAVGATRFEIAEQPGAPIDFTVTVTDAVTGSLSASCDPASGTTLAPGTHAVHCESVDGAGNVGELNFELQVVYFPAGWHGQVELEASSGTVTTTTTSTLLATVSEAVYGDDAYIQIFDVTQDQRVAACSTGVVCAATVGRLDVGSDRYVAVVGSSAAHLSGVGVVRATSGEVEVGLVSFAVDLEISAAVISTQQTATLTATANQSVQNTPYYLMIFNETTGQRVAGCYWSNACSATVDKLDAGTHDFRAYVAQNTTSIPAAPVAQSGAVSLTQLPFQVMLTTSAEVVGSQESATLTATANQSVQNTPYYLMIFNETTGARVAACYLGNSCSVSVRKLEIGTDQYRAYVAPNSTQIPGAFVMRSGEVSVTQREFEVELSISKPIVRSGESAVVRAVANQSVMTTPYSLAIYNVTTGALEARCYNVASCDATVSKSDAGTFEYQAFVAPWSVGLPVAPVATSGGVALTQMPFAVMLTVSKEVIRTDEAATITAVANQSVAGTPYYLFIYNHTLGEVARYCANVSVCSLTQTKYEAGTYEYRAYVAPYGAALQVGASSVVAASQEVPLSQEAWSVSIDQHTTPLPDGMFHYEFKIRLNQPVDNTPYHMEAIATFSDSTINGFWCYTGVECEGETTNYYTFVPDGYRAAFTGPTGVTVGPDPLERDGGSNPSEQCTSCSVADPVSTLDGKFFLSRTDLVAQGRGPSLRLERTYSVNRAGGVTSLGHGWRHNFDMRLVGRDSDGGLSADLADSRWIYVVQENGSQVLFEGPQLQGPSRVLATLHRNPDGTFTFVRRQRDTFTFDADGKLLSIADLNDNRLELAYDGSGRLDHVSDDAGRSIEMAYNVDGTLDHVTDAENRVVRYEYDGSGDLVGVVDPSLASERYGYDLHHWMQTRTDARGKVTHNTFDQAGRVVSQVDPLGRETVFDYSGLADITGQHGVTTTITAPSGVQTKHYYYDGMLQSVRSAVGTAQERVENYHYDPRSRGVTHYEDGAGNVWLSTYDAAGNRTSQLTPEGARTSWTYDELGNVTSVTDPLRVTTTIERDERGNATSISTPVSLGGPVATTELHYDDPSHPGDVTRVVSPEGETTQLTWTPRGDLASAVDAEGNASTFAYNAVGWLMERVSPRGNVPGAVAADFTTSVVRDAMGRVREVHAPAGRSTSATYDAAGNVETSTDSSGNTTQYAYDAAGQLTSEVRPDGTTVGRTYRPNGQLWTETDGLGRVTTYGYDPLDRVSVVTDPLQRETRYEYDGAGRVASIVDALQRHTSLEYDRAGHLASIDYGDAATPDASFKYDAAGRRTRMTDGTGTSKTTYDGLGRVTRNVDGSGAAVGYSYDLAGRLTELDYPGAGRVVSYGYDDAGRMDEAHDWLGGDYAFEPDPDGALSAITYPNGVETSFERNAAGAATAIEHATQSAALASFSYVRPASGLIQSETSTGVPGSGTKSYAYDELQRLTNQVGGTGSGAFDYTDAGDLKLRGDGAVLTYDLARQLEALTPQTGPATTFAYDAIGQRTSATTGADIAQFDYDQAGRLTSFESPTGVDASYAYDADGMRTSKTVDSTTQHMTWSSGGLPMLLDDSEHAFVYGPTGTPLAQIDDDDTPTYLHADQLGSIRTLTDEHADVTGTATYTAYGQPTTTGTTTPFGYAGEYTDAESGLQYLRARYYDAATAQFLTRDPIEDLTGDLNRPGFSGGQLIRQA